MTHTQNEVSVPAMVEAFTLMLKAMDIRMVCRMPNGLGEVKRHSHDTWVLFADGNNERSRWGNKEQISQDCAYFHEFGVLPEPDMSRW